VAERISKDDQAQIAALLRERMVRPVGLDVWVRPASGLVRTDRDSCEHCDELVQATRDLISLHPALSITLYDLDRHADRAEEAGVGHAPTTIIRGGGRSIWFTGFWLGMLLPPFLDMLGFASALVAPVRPETREALAAIEERVEIELMVTPFDPFSAHMVQLLGALAAESKQIRLHIFELSELPILASQRSVAEVPAITINGRRFTGAWEEPELVEQIGRVIEGNEEPVVRERVLATPYVSMAEAQRLAAEQAAQTGQQPGPPPSETTPSGLYVPGRD
jgi:hypothetical protein